MGKVIFLASASPFTYRGSACLVLVWQEKQIAHKPIEVNPKSWTVDYDANLVNLY